MFVFSLTFFLIGFLLQNRPYFLKKWNWGKVTNNIETKIITCTHFTQSEIVPQIVRNTTLTNNTTTTREQQNYNNKIITTTTTGGPEEKIISSQKSSKVLTLSGGSNQNHHTTTQLVTTGEFKKKSLFFCQTTACVYCVLLYYSVYVCVGWVRVPTLIKFLACSNLIALIMILRFKPIPTSTGQD